MTKYFLIDYDGSTVLDETLATSLEDAKETFDRAGWVIGEVMTESEYIETCRGKVTLKDFPKLGIDKDSDKFILPDHYKLVDKPYYKGDGNHSVSELQKLCRQFEEYCHQQAIIKYQLIKEIRNDK